MVDRYSRSIRRKDLKYFSCSLESAYCSSSSFYLLPVFEDSYKGLASSPKIVKISSRIFVRVSSTYIHTPKLPIHIRRRLWSISFECKKCPKSWFVIKMIEICINQKHFSTCQDSWTQNFILHLVLLPTPPFFVDFCLLKLRLSFIWSRTHSVLGHLVLHKWSQRTNGPHTFGPRGRMVNLQTKQFWKVSNPVCSLLYMSFHFIAIPLCYAQCPANWESSAQNLDVQSWPKKKLFLVQDLRKLSCESDSIIFYSRYICSVLAK